MRVLPYVCAGLLVGILASQVAAASENERPPLPVYVCLFAHFEDHINLELSEWRIKEIVGILSEAHKRDPDLVTAAGEFYGTDSEIFHQRNQKSGIVDLIRGCVKKN